MQSVQVASSHRWRMRKPTWGRTGQVGTREHRGLGEGHRKSTGRSNPVLGPGWTSKTNYLVQILSTELPANISGKQCPGIILNTPRNGELIASRGGPVHLWTSAFPSSELNSVSQWSPLNWTSLWAELHFELNFTLSSWWSMYYIVGVTQCKSNSSHIWASVTLTLIFFSSNISSSLNSESHDNTYQHRVKQKCLSCPLFQMPYLQAKYFLPKPLILFHQNHF